MNKKNNMSRNFGFLMSNIRYILAALLMIVVVLVLAKCTGQSEDGSQLNKQDGTMQESTSGSDSTNVGDSTDLSTEGNDNSAIDSNPLEKNAYPKMVKMIKKYYSYQASGNTDQMEELVDSLSDIEASSIVGRASLISEYKNIQVYTKKGPVPNSYIAFVYADIYFRNIKTGAPGLDPYYIVKGDGQFRIINADVDSETLNFINGIKDSADVQELYASVNEAYTKAYNEDDDLQNFINHLAEVSGTDTPEVIEKEDESTAESTNNGGTTQEPSGRKIKAGDSIYLTETVNLRKEPSETAEKVTVLYSGTTIKIKKVRSDGWCKVKAGKNTGFVKKSVIK